MADELLIDGKKRLFSEAILARFASGELSKPSGDVKKDKESAIRLAVALEYTKDQLMRERKDAADQDKQLLDDTFSAANTLKQRTLDKFNVTAEELKTFEKKTIEPELIKMNVALAEVREMGAGGKAAARQAAMPALLKNLVEIHQKVIGSELETPGHRKKRPGVGDNFQDQRDGKLFEPSEYNTPNLPLRPRDNKTLLA